MKLATVFLVLIFFLLFVGFSGNGRTTFIVASDPMVVFSWHAGEGTVTRITIPAEAHIEAIGGYGQYSLRGLWELGEIDERARESFPLSVQEALAIPVPYYLGPRQGGERWTDFSWRDLLPWRIVSLRTNLPFGTTLTLLRHLPFVRPDHIDNLTLAPGRGMSEVSAPDGSLQSVLDTNQTDVLLGTLFEEEDIRREGVPVAVYNTTTMNSLGTRIARLLSHIGFYVVAVENDEPVIERCEVRVSREKKGSVSVRLMSDLFDCAVVIDEAPKRADIVLRMGAMYARRFLPPMR